MKPFVRAGFTIACLAAGCGGASAEISLAPAFGQHMVLQRDSPVPIWGTATPGEKLAIEFAGQKKATRADAGGRWRVTLDPLSASFEPRTLTIGALSLTNVLVGEVWIAAGQSNMEWPLANEAHAAIELPAATNAAIRLLNLSFVGQYFYAKPFGSNELSRLTPEKFYAGAWQPCSPASAKEFSAVAYYFGRELEQELKVPVGILHLAVGGSPAEAWIRRAALAASPSLAPLLKGNWLTNATLDDWCRLRGHQNLDAAINSGLPVPGDDPGPNHPFKPGFLWEAGPAQLRPFAIRGVLWYQGESNALEPRRVAQHQELFPLLIRDWRAQWGQTRLPFLYCQLSAISTNGGYQAACWPGFRDQQRRFLDVIPDTAMAVTSDLGHPTDVHPRNKRAVGHRLALAALNRVYERGNEYSGPLVENARRGGAKVIVRFRHAKDLRTTDEQPPQGFEVAGADGKFFPATASIVNETVVLACPSVALAERVRYAWEPFPVPAQNLINGECLPASTFLIDVARDAGL